MRTTGVVGTILALILAGCAFPTEQAPDRGSPRLLNDGSEPVPARDCGTIGKPVGWRVGVYNVGGEGIVRIILYVDGSPRNVSTFNIAADSPQGLELMWQPIEWTSYEMEIRWRTLASDGSESSEAVLAGPVTRQYPCGTGCLQAVPCVVSDSNSSRNASQTGRFAARFQLSCGMAECFRVDRADESPLAVLVEG